MAEITREISFWNPTTGYSDEVTVKTSSGTVAVKKGTLLLSNGDGTYGVVGKTTDLTASATKPSKRVAVAIEEATATTTGVAVKAVVAGVVSIEALYDLGTLDSANAPGWILNEVGGLSNIAFVHVKEVK